MKYFVIGIVFIALFSCKPKSNEPQPAVFVGTPYKLVYPYYFSGLLNIPSDNPMSVEGIKLGRMLFYEKKLSSDNTISCGSCHKQKFAFADSVAFSSGVGGTLGTRNALALSNLAFQSQFFWDGRAASLELQVPFPIQNPLEMHQVLDSVVKELQATTMYPSLFKAAFGSDIITTDNIAKAISQFERTFVSYRSRYDQYLLTSNPNLLTAQEYAGLILFMQHPYNLLDPGIQAPIRGANCGDCHQGTLLTIQTFLNNGLDSVFKDPGYEDFTGNMEDLGKFKIPSLRNIALTAPYMHDGRFATLQDVLTHYNEHVLSSPTMSPKMLASNIYGPKSTYLALDSTEVAAVLAFLYTLTDSAYITDTTLSNPFINTKLE